MPTKIAVLIGSLRKESLTRKLAHAMIAIASQDLTCDVVELGDLPLYNEDLEPSTPAAWQAFRNSMRAAQGVMFFTPEYNRSVPGALKNAIDVGSRPYGQSVFSKKPAAVISQSPGAMGGFGANHALRQSLVFLDMPVLQQPEAYISQTGSMFAEDGSIADAKTGAFLKGLMGDYAAWASKILT